MKRSKNIFNSPIAHESLMEEEGNRDFKVGGKNIASNWLVGVDPQEYRRYIVSALKLSDLERELDELRESDLASGKQVNHFKIGDLKKKIDNFSLLEVEPTKPLGEQALLNNEPPETTALIVQKMGGFFNSSIQRKCKIQEKELFIGSQKDDKTPWITLGISSYSIELESKEKPLNKQQFKEHSWLQTHTHRLLLSSQGKKPYCIYGKEEELKRFQRYFQVQNLEVKQLGVFQKLDLQFQQKVITIFGNKVRFYDHNMRVRKAEKEAHYRALKHQQQPPKQAIPEEKPKDQSSEVGLSSEIGAQSSDMGHSGLLETNQLEKGKNSLMNSDIAFDGVKTPVKGGRQKEREKDREKEKRGGSEIFKLKMRTSTVFYDEIEEPLVFQDVQGYTVGDLKLNLKDQIGISDVDEQSESRSGASLSLRKDPKKKVLHMTLRNAMDDSEKFSINIHEVSSNDAETDRDLSMGSDNLNFNRSGFFSSQRSSSSRKSKQQELDTLLADSNLNRPYRIVLRKGSEIDTILDEFQLQKSRPDVFSQESSSSPSNSSGARSYIQGRGKTLIRDFKKKVGEVEIVEKLKPTTTFFAIQEIQMLMPYHSPHLKFEILQLDQDCQMQGKLVVEGRTSGTLEEVKEAGRYMRYTVEGGHHFRLSCDSDHLVFVLAEESKCHYIHFHVQPSPKYQRNCSQLLTCQLDPHGYPFACALHLHHAPNPVRLKTPLSTVEFIQKYLSDSQDYDFKHDFIDDKRRRCLIKREWNKRLLSGTVKEGDADGFARAVFLGMPESVFAKLQKGVSYNCKELWKFSENELRMMEENIISAGVMDLRAFMKPSSLIKHIAETHYNEYLRERLEQVYVFFLHRYGSTRNLALVFIKEVLGKLEPIILLCRREEEIYAVVDLYFEVEYEVDELFLEISKYFKK